MNKLDNYQNKAVMAMDKHSLIVAPPGSGKTTVIINRVKYLIENEGVNSNNIIVITFTKMAAQNMKTRFSKLISNSYLPFFGTFHGLFYKILLRHEKVIKIIEGSEGYNLIRKVLMGYMEEVSDEKIKEVLNSISLKKTTLNKEQFTSTVSNDIFDNCYKTYETYKKEKGLLDFDDLQIKCRELFINNKKVLDYYKRLFKYILVDEFQDCDQLQIDILKMLNTNIFCVGDEDQCIYSFRGSTPQCMIDFHREFTNGKKVYLKYNYRSLKNIVDLSKIIIKENKSRHNKEIISYRENIGDISFEIPFNEQEQTKLIINKINQYKNRGIRYSENAILYRTNMESRSLIDGFIRSKIPFKLLDKEYNFFNHFICQDLLAYLKLSIDPYDKVSFNRIINKPFRYISKNSIIKVINNNEKLGVIDLLTSSEDIHPFQIKNLEKLKKDISSLNKFSLQAAIDFILSDLEYSHYIREYCDKFKHNQQDLLEIIDEFKNSSLEFKSIINFLVHINNVQENLKEIKKSSNIDGVILSTIHGVKGMEFKNVYIIDLVDEILPHKNGMENIEEERRLFYVGITRAINNIHMYSPKSINGKFRKVSPFLPNELLNGKEKANNMGIKCGDIISHSYFGQGRVERIIDETIDISFEDNIIRRFSIKTLIENNIIKRL